MAAPMIGSNTLTFNKATMMLILQHYFDTVMFREGRSPKVTDINLKGGNTYSPGYEITVEEGENPTPLVKQGAILEKSA